MVGQLLKGKPVTESISQELSKQVDYWTSKGIIPKVATILVKGDILPRIIMHRQKKG